MTRSGLGLMCVALAVAGSAVPGQGDAEQQSPGRTVTWHLCDEFGVGHPGCTVFIVPDGHGGIWTDSANAFGAKLWHLTEDASVAPFTLSCPNAMDKAAYREGVAGTRSEGLRGLLGATVAEDGRLWVATSSGLLAVDGEGHELYSYIHPVTGFFGSFFGYRSDEPPPSSAPTTVVATDSYGELWVYGPGLGLIRRGLGTGTHRYRIWTGFADYIPTATQPERLNGFLGEGIPTVAASTRPGEMIVGTSGGELIFLRQTPHYNGTNVSLEERVGPPDTSCSGPVSDFIRDSQGRLWCAIGESVAMRDDEGWHVWSSANSDLPAATVTSVCEVRPGTVWAGVDWHDGYVGGSPPPVTGLYELRADGWHNVNPATFWDEPREVIGRDGERRVPRIYNECTRRITLIRTDDRGRIWVGSHGGLACFEEGSEA